jgi:arsenate reductase
MIEPFLHTSSDQFATRAPIPQFLPLMAERFARQRLRALPKVEGLYDDGKFIVLLLSTTPVAPRWRWASFST